MKNYWLFSRDVCSDKMFEYPCFNSNTPFLKGKRISIFGDDCDAVSSFLKNQKASFTINPTNKEASFSQIGIILPNRTPDNTEEGYYTVLDYYVETLQLLIHKMSGVDECTHIVVVLPPHTDEGGVSFVEMAYYAIYGLIKGLGELNAPRRIYINGIILSESNHNGLLNNWIRFLSSNNSNNIVGQVVKL